MILLDTDHISILADSRDRGNAELMARLRRSNDVTALPIIGIEELLRGWLAQIRRVNDPHRQIAPYLRLAKLIEFLAPAQIEYWTEPAAHLFENIRAAKVRIGSQDLKIACIALTNDALLISANLRDFEQVPRLRVENWLR